MEVEAAKGPAEIVCRRATVGRLGKFWAWLEIQSWLCKRMPLSKAFHLMVTLSFSHDKE